MPKLHDICQIFAEECLNHLGDFNNQEASYALTLAFHAVEEDMLIRHQKATEIIQHMWIVLDELLSKQHFVFLPINPDPEFAPVRDDDIRLAYLCYFAVETGRKLFPSKY